MPNMPRTIHERELTARPRRRRPDASVVVFVCAAALLVIYGLVIVASATSGSSNYSFSRQVFGVIVGLVVLVIIARFDYHKLAGLIVPLLIIDVILLLSPRLPIIGVSVNGARSWVRLGGFRFQPGELAKIVTIVLMAAVVMRYRGNLNSGREYLKVLGICAIPFVCIMMQPDLGSGLVILVIAATILFTGGANRKWLLLTIAVGIALIALMIFLDPILDDAAGKDVFIKDYQMNRLLVFINTDLDPSGAGYNLRQAKIAVGSGGLFGKGLGNGTQSSLGFLPEAPTDFVFCVLAEELGFVGAVVLLVLYVTLFFSALRVTGGAMDLFGTLIVCGIVGMWAFQVLENIGMDIGLMPITGIPLPFISYGSSSMLANLSAVGLVLSVWRHRQHRVSSNEVSLK
jgi:rod shape determining protein RodA